MCVLSPHTIGAMVTSQVLIFVGCGVGMAMGRSGAEGWDLRPRPAWIFLTPSPPRPA